MKKAGDFLLVKNTNKGKDANHRKMKSYDATMQSMARTVIYLLYLLHATGGEYVLNIS